MLQRCYSIAFHEKYPSYKNCLVCDEWLNYQNFAQWHENNYYEVEGQQMHLDKDILFKGNKMYSPKNCCIVPREINELFVKCDRSRGEYPIGVSYNKKSGKYICQLKLMTDNKPEQRYLGLYNSIYEAFNIYKKEKEKIIYNMAEKYKNKIPIKLYNALINYKVEITD